MQHVIRQYQDAFRRHGRSNAAVLCPKGRQEQRFGTLLRDCHPAGRSVLDFGCGLAHLKGYLDERGLACSYTGVDIVDEFIASNRQTYPDSTFRTIKDVSEVTEQFDVILASGVFNLVYDVDPERNLAYIESQLLALFERCRVALTVDFMTTRVDFQIAGAFHADPVSMLEFVQANLSRRVILNHGYLPFEFCLTILKDLDIDRERGLYVR